jgi:hypothetical protein
MYQRYLINARSKLTLLTKTTLLRKEQILHSLRIILYQRKLHLKLQAILFLNYYQALEVHFHRLRKYLLLQT